MLAQYGSILLASSESLLSLYVSYQQLLVLGMSGQFNIPRTNPYSVFFYVDIFSNYNTCNNNNEQAKIMFLSLSYA